MRVRTFGAVILLALMTVLVAGQQPPAPPGPEDVRARYTKYEFMVPMRDGAKLFTSIYSPKDTSQKYPFLITRTPYSVGPYGIDQYRPSLGPSDHFQKEGFIFVYQDARGRSMSEGEFQQVRPFVPEKKSKADIDESTDTYDTIEWLLKTVSNHDAWPPKRLQPMAMHLDGAGRLSATAPKDQNGFDEYVSDPNRPVPYLGYVGAAMTSDYMTEDQRFASRRTDVLTYRTDPLDRDLVVAGPMKVNLKVSSTGTDSDFVVKVIDV